MFFRKIKKNIKYVLNNYGKLYKLGCAACNIMTYLSLSLV